jgi:hypothetical protein
MSEVSILATELRGIGETGLVQSLQPKSAAKERSACIFGRNGGGIWMR